MNSRHRDFQSRARVLVIQVGWDAPHSGSNGLRRRRVNSSTPIAPGWHAVLDRVTVCNVSPAFKVSNTYDARPLTQGSLTTAPGLGWPALCYTPMRMTVRHARGPTEREVVTSLVRRVRAARAWRQADLARALGVSQSYVARLEAGARTSPSLRLWRRLQALAGEGEGRATA